MSVLTVRAELAATITTALDTAGVKAFVYPYPAETIALPAVVFVPDEPWWVPARFGSGDDQGTGVRVNFELQLVTPRTEVEEAVMAATEELALVVGAALASSPVGRWDDLGQPAETKVNGVDCIQTPLKCHAIV